MAGSARREFVRFGYAAGGLSLWKQEPTAWVASKPLMAQRTLGGLLPCVKLLQWGPCARPRWTGTLRVRAGSAGTDMNCDGEGGFPLSPAVPRHVVLPDSAIDIPFIQNQ
jgi:hypothetical protein